MSKVVKRSGKTYDGRGYAISAGSEVNANRLEEILASSDRVAVIVGLAYLEELLTEVLSTFMCGTQNEQRNARALSTFRAKVELAYLLGLISKEIKLILEIISELRNEFAHNSNYRLFDDLVSQEKSQHKLETLKNRATNLGLNLSANLEKNEAKATRIRYLALLNCLESELNAATLFAKSQSRSTLKSTHTNCAFSL